MPDTLPPTAAPPLMNAVPNPAAIPGWGIDADPENDPTFPMRQRGGDETVGLNWTRPSLQPSDVEVLLSIEHKRRPAVFGASTPPSGVSGAIRRRAFVFSESQWAHWLLLMLADRVNMVEGVIDDLRGGHVPNVPKEMGLASEWKYNRQAAIRRAAGTALIAGVITGLLVRRRKSRIYT